MPNALTSCLTAATIVVVVIALGVGLYQVLKAGKSVKFSCENTVKAPGGWEWGWKCSVSPGSDSTESESEAESESE